MGTAEETAGGGVLEYQATTPGSTFRAWVGVSVLRTAAVYWAISAAVLPFAGKLWIGEAPVLALIQLPKLMLAVWIRRHVVMPLMVEMGWSRGSWSPDLLAARPWALGLAYLLLLGMAFGLAWLIGWRPRDQRWAWALLAVAAIDYGLVLWLAGGPGFSMY